MSSPWQNSCQVASLEKSYLACVNSACFFFFFWSWTVFNNNGLRLERFVSGRIEVSVYIWPLQKVCGKTKLKDDADLPWTWPYSCIPELVLLQTLHDPQKCNLSTWWSASTWLFLYFTTGSALGLLSVKFIAVVTTGSSPNMPGCACLLLPGCLETGITGS